MMKTVNIEKIGNNAGAVWNALNNGEMEIKDLKKSVKFTDKELWAAIGWLAREDKLAIKEQGKEVFLSLK